VNGIYIKDRSSMISAGWMGKGNDNSNSVAAEDTPDKSNDGDSNEADNSSIYCRAMYSCVELAMNLYYHIQIGMIRSILTY
jgi:hypothetical protein